MSQRMIDRLFASKNLAEDAVYTPLDGEGCPVRVIRKRPAADDPMLSVGVRMSAAQQEAAARFDVRVSEVARPRRGDRIIQNGRSWPVIGTPVLDDLGLVWTVDVGVPVDA
ncbi:hypothetical protein [Telmatospirillum sp. J64-1]|uniref:head-tail joining protein n=1 Tax=Telmatospirillum sp. J64-1 TaxID=2502183 RepID=UPI00115C7A11|nr:hypothetical protein [Telmatospirillum sp. J64-1]